MPSSRNQWAAYAFTCAIFLCCFLYEPQETHAELLKEMPKKKKSRRGRSHVASGSPTKRCGGFHLCSFQQPLVQSWDEVPLEVSITTTLGKEMIALEPLVGDYVLPFHRQWGDPAVVLRSRRWYFRFLKCTGNLHNATWRHSCQQRPHPALIKTEKDCWADSIEDFDLFQKIIPAGLPSFARSFPKSDGIRYVLLDLGSREFASSSAALAKHYGKFGVYFDDIYAVEAQGDRVESFAADAYSSKDPAITKAISNTNIHVMVNLIDIESNKSRVVGPRGHKANVRSLDPVELLREKTRIGDFVVVKMDIEAHEYDVIPHMCKNGAFNYIDEFFVEIHFQEPERHACQAPFAGCSKTEAIQMISGLRKSGVAAHFWV